MITKKQEDILKAELPETVNGRRLLSVRGEQIMAHRCDWKDCDRCPLGGSDVVHVLFSKNHAKPERLDVLLIGEAPGAFESVTGVPFVGTTGKLLRKALDKARIDRFRWMITNAVACRPTENGKNNRQPSEEELDACAPRLLELVRIYNPKMIVFVGGVSRDHTGPYLKANGYKGRMANVAHPSYIMREGGESSRKYQQFVDKFIELFGWLEEYESRPNQNKPKFNWKKK